VAQDVNTTFSFGADRSPAGGNDTVWSFNGSVFFPGPAATAVVYRRQTDARMMVQPDLATALKHCNQFRTLDAHAKTVMQVIPALRDHPDDVMNTLSAVRDAGLLESSEQAWHRLTNQAGGTQEYGCLIFILTCDRPEALARLLNGLVAQSLPPQIEGICVIDDSRDPDCVAENEQALNLAKDQTDLPLTHFDMHARETLIKGLKAQLPDCETEIDFLLARSCWGAAPTFGIARNLTLLLSASKNALVFDDDVIPEAIAPPLAAKQMGVGTANDRQAFFYANEEALNQHALALPDSPVSLMLNHLGKPLGQIMGASLSGHQALAGWDGELLTRFNAQSPVLLTQCGSWGDPGTGSGEWAYFLKQPSVKRLLAVSVDVEQTLAARATWFGYRGPTITEYGTMSQLTGLANHTLLPPYLPAGRGEDTFFGLILQRMYPTSAVLNEGWAIRHAPTENRTSLGALSPIDTETGVGTVGEWVGREPADQWGQRPEANLMGVSEQILRLSTMDAEALAGLANQETVSKASSLLRRCFEHLDELAHLESEPGYAQWKGFLEQSRDQLVQRIQTPHAAPLSDSISASGDEATLRARGQQLASSLRAWPKMWEAARDLKI